MGREDLGHDEELAEDQGDRDGGALEDANGEAMDRWARAYDECNGAPDGPDDY